MNYGKNDHRKVVSAIAEGLQCMNMNGAYLELGIRKAACFNIVAPFFKDKYAIDTNIESLKHITIKSGLVWYNTTTDKFFEQHDKSIKFDMIFIDACHCHKASKQDFINSLEVLKDGGLILLHDTYPPNELYKGEHYCNDTWKTAMWIIDKKFDNIECCTLPMYSGLTVVRKFSKHLVWDK